MVHEGLSIETARPATMPDTLQRRPDPPTATPLQRLKGQVWCLWRLEGEPGLDKEDIDELGPVLDAFEPVLGDGGELAGGAGGEVARAVFMSGQMPSVGLRSGA
jgi:hypothetical protein